MRSFSALIDFLMSLMRDEDVRAAFERDPEATLASKGLEGVTDQDIRDARLAMADSGGARPTGGEHASSHHDGPVRETRHTTENDVDQTFNLFDVDVDDRDTLVVDSFNSADTNHVVAIQDNSRTDVDVLNVEDSFNGEPGNEEPDTVDPDGEDPLVEEPVAEEPVSEEPTEESTFEEEPVDEEPLEPDLDPVA